MEVWGQSRAASRRHHSSFESSVFHVHWLGFSGASVRPVISACCAVLLVLIDHKKLNLQNFHCCQNGFFFCHEYRLEHPGLDLRGRGTYVDCCQESGTCAASVRKSTRLSRSEENQESFLVRWVEWFEKKAKEGVQEFVSEVSLTVLDRNSWVHQEGLIYEIQEPKPNDKDCLEGFQSMTNCMGYLGWKLCLVPVLHKCPLVLPTSCSTWFH